MQKKITYIISNIDKALAFEWIAANLSKDKFKLSFILLNPGDSVLERFLKEHDIQVFRITFSGKKSILKSLFKTLILLKKIKPDVVHAHLFEASLIGLFAAWAIRVPVRIYTRHHSDFHHVYYPQAVKYDKLINSLSTDIIAISYVVKGILIEKEGVAPGKIHIVHHGFKLEDFDNVPVAELDRVRELYNPMKLQPVIGVISRYIEWKGIQYIIPAFNKLLNEYPDALLILANARGDYAGEIKKMLQHIPEKNYTEINFEHNIFALYKLFNVFVHVSTYSEMEGFGQTYIEALAAGIPSVFTLSGVANEFIKDRENALVVPFKNTEAIYDAVKLLLTDSSLAAGLIEKGKKDVEENFRLSKMISSLETLYLL